MSKLLIDDNPLQVLPKLAEAIGLNEAIVVQQLHYWLNKSTNEYDGKKWVYNTYAEWKETNFPFWSVQLIGNIFRSLEEIGLVISKQINKKEWNRRKWYTLNYKELTRIENQIIEGIKIIRSIDQNLDSLHITETTQETTFAKEPKTANGTLTDKQKTEEWLREKEDKKTPYKKKERKPLQMSGIESSIFAGRKTTEQDMEAERGDTLHTLLAGWYSRVSETDVLILQTFCEAFQKKPPRIQDGKKQSKFYYAWKQGLSDVKDAAQGGDLLKFIGDLGADYDDGYTVTNIGSIANMIYDKANGPAEQTFDEKLKAAGYK